MSMFDILSEEEKEFAKISGKIAAVILNKRHELDMSQANFAKMLGVSQGMISKWENLEYNFTIKNLLDLMNKLDVKVEILFNDKSMTKNNKLANPLQLFSCSSDANWNNLVRSTPFENSDLMQTGGAA